jgi:hypothetical protein
MNRALVGTLIAVAVVTTGVAFWAGPNPSISAPAAGIAVLAVGLLFVAAWADAPEPTPTAEVTPPERDEFLFRFGFRSGRLGREEIVATLDRIERTGPTPLLPSRSKREVASIVELPRRDFREYVQRRVRELEERT